MKKLLFVSSSLPPNSDSQTIRNLHFIDAIIRSGRYDVTLMVPWERPKDLPTLYNIIYSKSSLIARWDFLISRSSLNKFVKYIWANIIQYASVPDKYIGSSYSMFKEHASILNKFDVVVTASGSYSLHMFGALNKSTFSSVHIAELGDPWYGNPIFPENLFYRKWINKFLERRALLNVDLITLTNSVTAEIYNKRYGVPTVSVPMGYENVKNFALKNRTCIDFIQKNKGKKIIFAYIGVSYKSSRNLMKFITAIGANAHLTLMLIGPHTLEYESINSKIQDELFFLDSVNYSDSLAILDLVDVNVAIGNTGGLQIPGKIYQLIGTAKPIFYIYQSSDDPALCLLRSYGGVICVPNKYDEINAGINEISKNFESFVNESKNRVTIDSVLNFKWEVVSESFLEAIDLLAYPALDEPDC